MKNILALLLFFSFNCFACEEEKNTNIEFFAKIIEKDFEAVYVAVFYPNTLDKAQIESVSFIYFKNEKFFMTINSSILKHSPGIEGIDMSQYSWSYIAVKESALSDIEVVVSYRWPPSEDGAIAMCGPEKRGRLNKLVRGV